MTLMSNEAPADPALLLIIAKWEEECAKVSLSAAAGDV
jgi:hypothetical protein